MTIDNTDQGKVAFHDRRMNRFIAGVLSSLFPGIGHLVLKQRFEALVWISTTCLMLVVSYFWRPWKDPIYIFVVFWIFLLLFIASGCDAVWRKRPLEARKISYLFSLVLILISCYSSIFLMQRVWYLNGYRSFSVPTSSMENTIRKDESIIADMHVFSERSPVRGEAVIMLNDSTFTVKRIIAIEGDTISSKGGVVWLNGKELIEPYVIHIETTPEPWMMNFGAITLKPGEYFLMGDNRDVSLDSRSNQVGVKRKESIVGKPLYVVHSSYYERIGTILH